MSCIVHPGFKSEIQENVIVYFRIILNIIIWRQDFSNKRRKSINIVGEVVCFA
jgi:hypothetical protein